MEGYKMKEKRTLEEIRKFVEKTAIDQFSEYMNNKKVLEIKDKLKNASQQSEKEFTFTIGEMNAYMG